MGHGIRLDNWLVLQIFYFFCTGQLPQRNVKAVDTAFSHTISRHQYIIQFINDGDARYIRQLGQKLKKTGKITLTVTTFPVVVVSEWGIFTYAGLDLGNVLKSGVNTVFSDRRNTSLQGRCFACY